MKISNVSFIVAALMAFSASGFRTATELSSEYENTPKESLKKFFLSLTEDEWREMANYSISVFATNRVAARKIHPAPMCAIGNPYLDIPNAKALAGEYDKKFADAGYEANPAFFMFTMPMCSKNFMSNTNNIEKIKSISYGLSLKRKYGVIKLSPDDKSQCTIAEYINCLIESMMSRCRIDSCDSIEKKKKYMCLCASRLVKRTLRANGKSFVSKGGVNPLDAPMKEFVESINAPKFSGVKHWMSKWAPEHEWVEPQGMSDDEVSKIMKDILNGDKELDCISSGLLNVYLGTKAYNMFVDEYNNGTKK